MLYILHRCKSYSFRFLVWLAITEILASDWVAKTLAKRRKAIVKPVEIAFSLKASLKVSLFSALTTMAALAKEPLVVTFAITQTSLRGQSKHFAMAWFTSVTSLQSPRRLRH